MKLEVNNKTLESNGLNQSEGFKIEASLKAFEILSSGLYADKIGSIIRELISNAYDSHVQANNLETPIEITTPTSWSDSIFKIKDFGTGLSEEDIFTIYTTYFKSTKTESNDYIGCLGLGSKSPFSYTDSFTVESRFNGVLTSYLCYKDDKGPAITKLESNPTDEHNGLTVIININYEDSYEFKNKIKEFLNYANINIKVNNEIFKSELGEPLKKINDIEMFKSDRYYGGVYIKQGIVCYPINSNISDDASFKQYMKLLSSYKTIITVPIGSVEVTASREALSYDERTTKNVIDYIAEAGNAFLNEYREIIKGLNPFEISFKLQSEYSDLVNIIKNDLKNIFPEFKIFSVDRMFDEINLNPKWIRNYSVSINENYENGGSVTLEKYPKFILNSNKKLIFTSNSSAIGKHEKMIKIAKDIKILDNYYSMDFILVCCSKEDQQKFIDSFPGIEKYIIDLDLVKLDRKHSEKTTKEYRYKSLNSDYKDVNFNTFNKDSIDDFTNVIYYIPIEGSSIIGLEHKLECNSNNKTQLFKSLFDSNNCEFWKKKFGNVIYFLTTPQIKRLTKLEYKLINIIPLIYKKAYQVKKIVNVIYNDSCDLRILKSFKDLIKDKKLLRCIEIMNLAYNLNYYYTLPHLDNKVKNEYIDNLFTNIYNKYKILKYLNRIDEDFFKLGYL